MPRRPHTLHNGRLLCTRTHIRTCSLVFYTHATAIHTRHMRIHIFIWEMRQASKKKNKKGKNKLRASCWLPAHNSEYFEENLLRRYFTLNMYDYFINIYRTYVSYVLDVPSAPHYHFAFSQKPYLISIAFFLLTAQWKLQTQAKSGLKMFQMISNILCEIFIMFTIAK